MEKPIKGKSSYSAVPLVQQDQDAPGHDIARIVEDVLAAVGRHDAEPTDGVLSLLTALMQAADRVLEMSTPEDTEHNRAALLAMLDHGRRFVDGWPHRTPQTWSVH